LNCSTAKIKENREGFLRFSFFIVNKL